MTVLRNGFEGGTTGGTITAANSGGASGNAFDAATLGSGGTLAYDSTHAAHGTLSCKLASTTAVATSMQWIASFGAQSTFWWRGYFYFTANPGSTTIRLFNCTTGAGSVMSCSLNSSGKMTVTYSTGGTNYVTFTDAVPLNAWFRVEGLCVVSTSAGQVGASLYDTMDSTTATETHTSAASLNTGSLSGTTTYNFGDSNGVGSVGPYWIDDVGLSSSGPLGPAAASGVHRASPVAALVAAGAI